MLDIWNFKRHFITLSPDCGHQRRRRRLRGRLPGCAGGGEGPVDVRAVRHLGGDQDHPAVGLHLSGKDGLRVGGRPMFPEIQRPRRQDGQVRPGQGEGADLMIIKDKNEEEPI